MVRWTSFKYKERFHGSCSICIKSAKESHCSKIHCENFCVSLKICKNRKTFLSLNLNHLLYISIDIRIGKFYNRYIGYWNICKMHLYWKCNTIYERHSYTIYVSSFDITPTAYYLDNNVSINFPYIAFTFIVQLGWL